MKNVNKNEGWDDISKEDSSHKPITAWTVEIDGKIHPYDIVGTRSSARMMRNEEVIWNPSVKASVRKVTIQVIPGAR